MSASNNISNINAATIAAATTGSASSSTTSSSSNYYNNNNAVFKLMNDETIYLLPRAGIHLFVTGGTHVIDQFLLVNGLMTHSKPFVKAHQRTSSNLTALQLKSHQLPYSAVQTTTTITAVPAANAAAATPNQQNSTVQQLVAHEKSPAGTLLHCLAIVYDSHSATPQFKRMHVHVSSSENDVNKSAAAAATANQLPTSAILQFLPCAEFGNAAAEHGTAENADNVNNSDSSSASVRGDNTSEGSIVRVGPTEKLYVILFTFKPQQVEPLGVVN